MRAVIFGLTVTSSWGNGHATIWRGLLKALSARGHGAVFFEKDVPYYAAHRDLDSVEGTEIILYGDFSDARSVAQRELDGADMALVTSYCPDGVEAARLVLDSNAAIKAFYDLDAPVTLKRLERGESVDYIGPDGLSGFDLVLSYTGGRALTELKSRLGAKRVEPLYGCVDPSVHAPVKAVPHYAADLSYLGTWAADRQDALSRLFMEPARMHPEKKFLIGGSLYPESFPWRENIFYMRHVPPPEHPSFYCSSSFTLNVTRGAMAEMGWCPSGRLFEAASCGVPIISDYWEGLGSFFTPGHEIVTVDSALDVAEALSMGEEKRKRIGRMARERALEEHTALQRVKELERIMEGAASKSRGRAGCGG